jgi:DNA-binding SARP family transcriptional activator
VTLPQPQASRVQLQVLGPVSVVRSDGGAPTPLLTQPRRLAVLAYLVLARPRGLHSRDTLTALLWPEADQAGGRHALRNALHGIRQALGEVIITAGDGHVGVDRDLILCDAIALEADFAAGRWSEGVARYTGELLQGFHVADALEFERWLDAERSRLHDLVYRAAVAFAESCRARGDIEGALRAARQASALAPDDEVSLRRLMQILGMAGDRAGALREYDKFVARADEDYGVQPAAETVQLARLLRAPPAPSARAVESVTRDNLSGASSVLAERSATQSAVTKQSSPLSKLRYSHPGKRRKGVVVAGGVALVVIMLTIIGWRALAGDARSISAETGDQPLDVASRLPERYRADTALLRRYLAAEANRFGRQKAARDSFQHLVDEAPLYAPGWAGLSFILYQSAFDEIPPGDALPRAVAAANRALALDSSLVEAQTTLISNAMFGRWDLPDAKRRLDLALVRYPNDPELTNLLATWHRWRGEVDEAVRLKQKAHAIDPLSPRLANQAVSSLYFAHRCREAAEAVRRIAEERREHSFASLHLYRSLKCLGKMDEAAMALRESLIGTGDTALAKLLDPPLPPAKRDSAIHAVFRARLNQYFAERQRRWRPSTVAMVQYAELGNRDSTLVWLDSMYVERAMMLHVVPFDPMMDFLRDDPRFAKFLDRLPWLKESR